MEFGAVYEHSRWVAENVFDQAMVDCLETSTLSADSLAEQFASVFLTAPRDRQLATLRAHPELACARAETEHLTADSRREQAGAGLDQCSEIEFNQFRDMNSKYMIKNEIPFIIAVKGRARQQILEVFQQRLENDPESEFQTALQQVCQIGRFRIGDILGV